MIKLPRRYTTCGIPLKIKRISGDGGEFESHYNNGAIGISKSAVEAELMVILVHEMAEVSAAEMGIRYSKTVGAKDYLFCCNHEQFSLWMQELARGMYDTLLLNRGKT